MKNLVRTVCATALLLVAALGVGEACSPAVGKQIAKSVIDVGLALCIAAHPDMDSATLKGICHYADELAPTVEELLSAQQKAAKAGGCGKAGATLDAGAVSVKEAGKD
jgi:hypothetical protein